LRQHLRMERDPDIGAVDGLAACMGLHVERTAGCDERADVGDRVVDAVAVRPALEVHRLVEIQRAQRVDGDERQVREVGLRHERSRRRRLRLLDSPRAEVARRVQLRPDLGEACGQGGCGRAETYPGLDHKGTLGTEAREGAALPRLARVLVLLPPSEGKAPAPKRGRALDLDGLSFPALTATRAAVLAALVDLAAGPRPAALDALGLTDGQSSEVDRDLVVFQSPTASAERLYTGVLYQSLDLASLSPAARRRARSRVVVASAAFGAVRLVDRLPTYRLSISARLPGLRTLASLWRPALAAVLPEAAGSRGLVVDLRSGSYAAAWRPSAALQRRTVTVRVLQEARSGDPSSRSIVSHANKSTKGLLLRAILEEGSEPTSARALTELLGSLGFQVEGPHPARGESSEIDVVVDAP